MAKLRLANSEQNREFLHRVAQATEGARVHRTDECLTLEAQRIEIPRSLADEVFGLGERDPAAADVAWRSLALDREAAYARITDSAIVLADEAPGRYVSIAVSPEAHRLISELAEKLGLSRGELVARAVEAYAAQAGLSKKEGQSP